MFFLVITLVSLLCYALVVTNNQANVSRGGEVLTPWLKEFPKAVNDQRQIAFYSPLSPVFVNKYGVFAKTALERYLGAFSPDRLFVNGEFRAAFSYQQHGTFYVLDFIFIILGLAMLYEKNKRNWFLLVALILVSPITSALSLVEYSYSQRAGLLFPFLIIFIGIGISGMINYLKKYNLGKALLSVLAFSYLFLFSSLMYTYFIRFPVYASDGWFFQDRLLARYIALASQEDTKKIVVVTQEPKLIFEEYLFYNNLYTKDTAKEINIKLDNKNYNLGKVEFVSDCQIKDINKIIISDTLLNCQTFESPLRITRFQDVYAKYLIEGDNMCKANLPTYIGQYSLSKIDIEQLDAETLCTTWLTKI